jgi:hypothetical protein
VIDAPPPVFVDDTGRRQIRTRRLGRAVLAGLAAYLGLVVLGFTRDPGVGSIHLPTFGLPNLALATPPPPPVAVLGEQAFQAAGETPAPQYGSEARPGGTAPGAPSWPDGGPNAPTPSAGATVTQAAVAPQLFPTTTTTAKRNGTPASSTTTSTTAPAATTNTTAGTAPSTTTTTVPGQGQGYGSASAKGPEGGGAPGQLRKTTTTTSPAG